MEDASLGSEVTFIRLLVETSFIISLSHPTLIHIPKT